MKEVTFTTDQKKKRVRIPLNTVGEVRKYLSRKIRQFEGDPSRGDKIQEYRCAGFLAKTLLEAFEREKIEEIEKRIEEIEKRAI